MIKKINIINKILEEAFVLVLRTDTKELGLNIAKASIKGGCKLIEVTFTIPDAQEVIRELRDSKDEEVCIGAGTVLDSETARIAIISGADFIVSPTFNKDTAIICNRYGVPYISGCFTPREILEAREYGVDIIKLFPGSVFKPSIIKDIKSPIKDIGIMVSGGVTFENIDEWLKNGCDVISVGSSIVNLKESEKVELETRKYIDRISMVRNGWC